MLEINSLVKDKRGDIFRVISAKCVDKYGKLVYYMLRDIKTKELHSTVLYSPKTLPREYTEYNVWEELEKMLENDTKR